MGNREKFREEFHERDHSSEAEKAIRAGYESLASPNHPQRNEDSFLAMRDRGVFAVADGLGGYEKGEEASRIATSELKQFFESKRYDIPPEAVPNFLREAVLSAAAQLAIFGEGFEEMHKPSTTLSLVQIVKQERDSFLAYAQLGDSRIYLKKKDGDLSQVTVDHDVFDMGFPFNQADEETKAEARRRLANAKTPKDLEWIIPGIDTPLRSAFKLRSVMSASLSSRDIDNWLQTGLIKLEAGDSVIITSDGVHDNLVSREISEAVSGDRSAQEKAVSLASLAASVAKLSPAENIRAKKDDTTAIVIEIGEET